MSKFNERLLQFDEEPPKKKWPYILALVGVIFVLIFGIVLFINRESVAEQFGFVGGITGKKDKEATILSNLDENKTYDKASGLIVPKAQGKSGAFISLAENIGIQINNVKGNVNGYTFDLEFYMVEEDEPGNASVNRIYIDGFDTSIEAFSMNLSYGNSFSKTVTIPKTELDRLGINDFNTLTFNMSINRPEQPKTLYRYFTITVPQIVSANNTITDIVHLYTGTHVQINYYKTETDSRNNYIYFDIRDLTKKLDTHYRYNKIIVNQLLLNDTLVDTQEEITIYGASEKFMVIEVPKSTIRNIESISASFIISYYEDNQFGGYTITNQMKVSA